MTTLFELGRTMSTPAIVPFKLRVLTYLNRHLRGDWGDMSEDDSHKWSKFIVKVEPVPSFNVEQLKSEETDENHK